MPVVWVEVSDRETKAPDTERVETNEVLVTEVREMSSTFPVMEGVTIAVE